MRSKAAPNHEKRIELMGTRSFYVMTLRADAKKKDLRKFLERAGARSQELPGLS